MRLPAVSQNAFSPTRTRPARMLAVAAAVAFALAACSQPDPELLGSHAAPPAQSAALDVHSLLDAMLSPSSGDQAAAALAAAPTPLSTQRLSVRNLHQPSQQDTLEVRTYEGAAVEVYEVSATGARFIKSVKVTQAGTEFLGLTVGMPLSEALEQLDSAGAKTTGGAGNTYILYDDRTAPTQVALEVISGELSAYSVSGYLD